MPSETVDSPSRGGALARGSAFLAAAIVGIVTAAAAAVALVNGNSSVAAAVLPYLGLLVGVWVLSRGNLPVVVLTVYLIGPVAADNLLPQVNIFPTSDYALRPRDMFFIPDLVLLAVLAIAALRARSGPDRIDAPDSRWLRWWGLALVVLALYPVAVGAWFGAGQSVPSLVQGATMPLRGVAMAGLIALWVRRHGWQSTLRAVLRTFVVTGVLLAIAAVGALILAHIAAPGQNQYTFLGYPLVVDRRPSLPGWGNNILSNYLCVCVAIAVLLRHRLAWRRTAIVIAVVALLIGQTFTEVRIAMVVSLLMVGATIVASVLRRTWPSRGAIRAIALAALAGVAFVGVAAVTLPTLNPRFATLTPGVLAHELPRSGEADTNPPKRDSFDAQSGVDLGGESFSTRGGLVEAAVGVWSHDPVLGRGWNSWGWAKSSENHRLVIAIDPHNGLLWLLAETGVFGLLLLYAIPVTCLLRRPWLLWLWAVPAVATLLELVNPNLRDGHFAVTVWTTIALALLAPRSVLAGPVGAASNSAADAGVVKTWRAAGRHAVSWLRGR